jgi:triacylglycerol lipase
MDQRWVRWTGALALAWAAIAPASAQLANLPPDVRSAIAAMGPNLNPEVIAKTFALMRPLAQPTASFDVKKNVAYGKDPLERLDVYLPKYLPSANGGLAPVVIFVHGGGFVRGDKNDYDNVPAYFARNGLVGVNINYRLAPKATFPAGAEDVGRAVEWVKVNAKSLGGDAKRIFVIGHSAGASNVASYVLDKSLTPKDGLGVAGAILISGPFHADASNPADAVYFGTKADEVAAHAPIAHVNDGKLPLLIVMAEFDPPFLAPDSHELAMDVCKRDGKCPAFLWLAGHNHISETGSLDTGDARLGVAITDFIDATR